jgi:hypothetical protein
MLNARRRHRLVRLGKLGRSVLYFLNRRRDVGVPQKLLDECEAYTLREPESSHRVAEADQQTLSKLLSKSPRREHRGL